MLAQIDLLDFTPKTTFVLCAAAIAIVLGITIVLRAPQADTRRISKDTKRQLTRKQKRSFEKAQESGWNGDDLPSDLYAKYFTEKEEGHDA